MKYVFDIDGTICTNSSPDYSEAKPYKDRIAEVNRLFKEGHTIFFYTARGMGRYNNHAELANSVFYKLTNTQKPLRKSLFRP